ncbi:MAG: GHMP kinase [Candidatus Competibacteraceae bacterium]|nr:GHMP kinase [Candidatus Competibacteraceae bacterium]
MPAAKPNSVRVTAPARLHLGFLDLNGGLGRRFGSLGLALEQPAYRLHLTASSRLTVQGPDAARAERYARTLSKQLGWPDGVHITIEQAIPAHSGLGSGTQLALAVGMGIARLFALPAEPARVASMLQRGARSGIGIGTFAQGGFILDGGHREATAEPPPIIARIPFPEAWRVVLIFDRNRQGFSGGDEQRAFTELPLFPEEQAARLCRLVLMQALPSLLEADFSSFGSAVSTIQQAVGDYFAPVQGGRFTSPAVTAVLNELARERVGLGQSSWGPTGFALCENDTDASRLLARLKARWTTTSTLHFAIGNPRNQPGLIESHTDELQRTVG